MPIQEATPTVVVSTLSTSACSIVVPSSIIVAPLLSMGVATTSAHVLPPLSSLAPPALASTLLVMASPSMSYCPNVSFDHLYIYNETNSLWGANYKLE